MLIDIIYAVLLILAIIKGFQRGLIIGLFSLVSIIIGIAAALKLSAVVAGYIGSAVKISEKWLPVISFIIVFLVVLLLIRLGARAIERVIEVAMLGWVNKLGGIILYVIMYTIVFSVFLFYAEKMALIKPATIQQSICYNYVQPWGPKVINAFGSIIPVFKNLFEELGQFFEGVANDIKK